MQFVIIFFLYLFTMHTYANGEAKEPTKLSSLTNHRGEIEDNLPLFVITGNSGFYSDYIYRGQTFTFGGPAVQGELFLRQKKDEGAYVGIWGSNVDSTTATNG